MYTTVVAICLYCMWQLRDLLYAPTFKMQGLRSLVVIVMLGTIQHEIRRLYRRGSESVAHRVRAYYTPTEPAYG
jgi:hypothetical protein